MVSHGSYQKCNFDWKDVQFFISWFIWIYIYISIHGLNPPELEIFDIPLSDPAAQQVDVPMVPYMVI